MFCGSDNILRNILNVKNILQNIVNPAEYCYGSE